MLIKTLYKVAKCIIINNDLILIRNHLAFYKKRFTIYYSGKKFKNPLVRITDRISKNIIEFEKVSDTEIKCVYLRYKGDQIFDPAIICALANKRF